jgi:hypothetical protein
MYAEHKRESTSHSRECIAASSTGEGKRATASQRSAQSGIAEIVGIQYPFICETINTYPRYLIAEEKHTGL